MTTNALSSRERVSRALDRKDHDRVPRHDGYWAQTLHEWRAQGLVGDPYEHLQGDLAGFCWMQSPAFLHDELVKDEGETVVVRDLFGAHVRRWKDPDHWGTPTHVSFDCTTREKWESLYEPLCLENGIATDFQQDLKGFAEARKHGKWTYMAGLEGFEMLRRLLGDEEMLYAMAEDPDWVIDISRTTTDVILQSFQNGFDAGMTVDGLWIYGDMAYNHSTLCSPDMYRELIWPDHKRLADWAHDHGMKIIFHTDGDVNAVIPMYIEAGFDTLQPLEAKANMDVRELFPKYGDRLGFFGNIDARVMVTNDLDAMEHEVRSKLEAGMPKNGYIYHSDHSVPPGVEWQTYRHIIHTLDRYGNY